MSFKTHISNDVSDSLALNVKGRLERCDVAEVRYHPLCRVQFSRLGQKASSKSVGRPQDCEKMVAFNWACLWLEN